MLMTDNKKPGIRLRHLEQKYEQEPKRSTSPLNGNRKKIFERLPDLEKHYERILTDDLTEPPSRDNPYQYSSGKQYEHLLQAFKNKSAENEQKDNVIRKLKSQIEDLKTENGVYRKQVSQLKMQIQRLERVGRLSRQIVPQNTSHSSSSEERPERSRKQFANNRQQFIQGQSQKDRKNTNMPNIPQTPDQLETLKSQSRVRSNQTTHSLRNRSQQITMMSMNFGKMPFQQNLQRRYEYQNENAQGFQKQQILSPFMALNTKPKSSSNSMNISKKAYQPSNESRNFSATTDIFYDRKLHESQQSAKHTSVQNSQSAFPKFTLVDRNGKQSTYENRKVRKEAPQSTDYPNVFESFRRQEPSRRKLQIQDSRQFKFEDFNTDQFQDAQNDTIY